MMDRTLQIIGVLIVVAVGFAIFAWSKPDPIEEKYRQAMRELTFSIGEEATLQPFVWVLDHPWELSDLLRAEEARDEFGAKEAVRRGRSSGSARRVLVIATRDSGVRVRFLEEPDRGYAGWCMAYWLKRLPATESR